MNGTSGECNNGAITGRSMRVENDANCHSDCCLYVSQLEVVVGCDMIGRDIKCIHDNGTISNTIGSRKLNISASVLCTYTATISGNLNSSTVHTVISKGKLG